jgi:hypothetical protein
VPEVSITHGGALLRTAAHVNVVVNRMTSVTLLKIRGDQRHLRLRTLSPPLWSLVEDVAPMGKSGFRALAGPLRQVQSPDKFKTGNINQYDSSSNLDEFI